jgi:hypothetical protein
VCKSRSKAGVEQLKAMSNEGVIPQAQYNKASQEVLNAVLK